MKSKMQLNQEANSLTIEEAYQKFIYVKTILNVSAATLKHYDGTYKQFIQYQNKNSLCDEINDQMIFGFIEFLKSRNPDIKIRTINSYLVDLRTFFNYLAKEEIIKKITVSLLRDEEKVKETYSDSELEKLLKKPDMKKSSFSEYRNWVIINYLLATGNRASTVCNLKIKDLDFDNKEIILKKLKAKRQYIIPMSTSLQKIMKEYLLYRKRILLTILFFAINMVIL